MGGCSVRDVAPATLDASTSTLHVMESSHRTIYITELGRVSIDLIRMGSPEGRERLPSGGLPVAILRHLPMW